MEKGTKVSVFRSGGEISTILLGLHIRVFAEMGQSRRDEILVARAIREKIKYIENPARPRAE